MAGDDIFTRGDIEAWKALQTIASIIAEEHPKEYPFGHHKYKPPPGALLPSAADIGVNVELKLETEAEAERFHEIFFYAPQETKDRVKWHIAETGSYSYNGVTIERGDWTLDQAGKLCQSLEPVVSRSGFLLSIYGSTVRNGRGRDLDIILSQKRLGISAEYVCEEIRQHLDAIRIVKPESSLFAEHCELLLTPDGHLLDIQVWLARNRMDALDFYERYGSR